MGQCVSSSFGVQENHNTESCTCRTRHHGGLFHKKHKHRQQQPHDPLIYDSLQRKQNKGQAHLLYSKKSKSTTTKTTTANTEATSNSPTRLLERINKEDGSKHVYAVRCSEEEVETNSVQAPEQRPNPPPTPITPCTVISSATCDSPQKTTPDSPQKTTPDSTQTAAEIYAPQAMAALPPVTIADLVCVSEQHNVYVCDTNLSPQKCDDIVFETEQACRGHYAAYTYAKQTLGCREFPSLARACLEPVHLVSSTIQQSLQGQHLVLDDREPHMVKYDISKKERQKLDMHTDKSEWTFLIALSDGCGMDYDGGGTYFEALDATVHVQRGHALIFPGKLRHCGKKISRGLRFLLVGFLVDKTKPPPSQTAVSQTAVTQTAQPQVPQQQQQAAA